MDYKAFIRDIPDFPKPGIIFKDITPLLANHKALTSAIEAMADPFRDKGVDLVIGMESRGFIFGPAMAVKMGCGFAPVRKPGKLPYQTHAVNYDLEYGTDSLEIHIDAARPHHRVLIVDDLIATGGTAQATGELVTALGATVVGYSFLIELAFLNGKQKLGDTMVHSILTY